MKLPKVLIILSILIIILFYFQFQKKYQQHFTVPLSKPQLNIHKSSSILWINEAMDKIKLDTKTFHTIFHPTEKVFYTNRSIDSSEDYYVGFYFEITEPLQDIKIGLHHTTLENLKNPINQLDFCFNFLPESKLQIIEKVNPHQKNDMITGQHLTQNLSYCFHKNKKCLETPNTINIQDEKCFAILIDQNMINYMILKKNMSTQEIKGGLLFHQSQNKFKYPLYPVIINHNKINNIKDFRWCTSEVEIPDLKYSVEFITKQKYNKLENSRNPPNPLKGYPGDIAPAPTPITEKQFLYDWERKIEILSGKVDMENKILHLYVKVYNITQDYLRKIYGVNILLSVDLPNKKHKKLIIPYIPHQKENNLIMNKNNIISMAVDMTAHLKYFYNRKIRAQVVIRLGEFTTDKNLTSNFYVLDF